MRPLLFGLAALAFAVPAQAQETRSQEAQPNPGSTFVVPSMPGEAIRVTTYAQRPTERGRLSQRYRGLRANRTARAAAPRLVQPEPAERTISTPRHTFVRRGGSFYQVVPKR